MDPEVPRIAGIRRPSVGLLVARVIWLAVGGTSQANDYTVMNTDNSGLGSLRQA